MKLKFNQRLLALLWVTLASANCWAASTVTCGIPVGTNVAFTINPYVVGGTANYVGKKIPISCTRSGNGNNAETMTVTVNIGNGASGATQNTAAGSGTINYDFYTTPGNPCTNESHGSTNPITASIVVPGGSGTTSGETATIYACVPPPAASASGTYSDLNVVVSIPPLGVASSNNGTTVGQTTTTGVLAVSIFIPERCVVSMPIGDLSVNYTAFSGTAVTGSKTYKVTCGSTLSPSMALVDGSNQPLTSGVAAGLNYTLGLNTSANNSGGSQTLSVAPGGLETEYRINANIAAGQPGSCASPAMQSGSTCTQTISNTHWMTVSW
jgi:Spore Coat Protein U domain